MGIKNKLKRGSFLYFVYLYKNLLIDNKFFLKRKSYSQFGEDNFITMFFDNFIKKGTYVDIGCFHPLKYSNTAKLYDLGWNGYNIDINKTSIDLYRIARPKDKNFNVAISENYGETKKYYHDGFFSAISSFDKNHLINFGVKKISESTVKTDKFENLIKDKFDFLNIDCEGYDYEILKQIDLNFYDPKLICIEITKENFNKINEFLKNYNYHFLKKIGISYLFKKI